MTIDTSFARAAQLVLAQREETHIALIGCGGTGSWLAPAIVRIARLMLDQNRKVSISFVDPDIVEDVNLYRQNFCQAELGRNKAEAVAVRYSAAWGVEIGFRARRFDQKLDVHWHVTAILVGCVDNAPARKMMSDSLGRNNSHGEPPSVWWLDCGNSKEHGQVLLGSATKRAALKAAFPSPKICHALPSPALQAPGLLKAQPEERKNGKKRMSCAELQAANAQSLSINQRIAAEAADYLVRMLIGPGLRKFATDIDLVTGSARSRAITPEEVNA